MNRAEGYQEPSKNKNKEIHAVEVPGRQTRTGLTYLKK